MNPGSASFVDPLGDGLVRRWSTPEDAEALAVLGGLAFRSERDPSPNPRAVNEVRLLMRGDFPYMTPADVAVVEDTTAPGRRLVACTHFWRHRWSFAGIPFGVTRPEMVATHPDYRNRGLIRSLFEMIHARSDAEGHLLQAITGIAYFYRQFGYEYVLDLEGGRGSYMSLVPEKEGDDPEACSLRMATQDDVPQIVAMYQQGRERSLVWHEPDEARWRWVTGAWDDPVVQAMDVTEAPVGARFHMLVGRGGEIVGSMRLPQRRYGKHLWVTELWLASDVHVPELVPSLLRALRDHARATPGVTADIPAATELLFEVGRAHPILDVLGDAHAPRVLRPYAWYIRVPNVAAFLRLIAPVLEERLSRSVLTGYTGTLVIDLYREAHELRFEDGRLVAVEPWQRPAFDGDDWAGLGCPPLVFLQLLLGYRSFSELSASFPDVGAADERRLLVETLFPTQPSTVEPLG